MWSSSRIDLKMFHILKYFADHVKLQRDLNNLSNMMVLNMKKYKSKLFSRSTSLTTAYFLMVYGIDVVDSFFNLRILLDKKPTFLL